MLSTIILLSNLACPKTLTFNTSKYPWNDYDHSMMQKAEKRCGEIYPDAPCLKLWKKYDFQAYTAICGFKSEPK